MTQVETSYTLNRIGSDWVTRNWDCVELVGTPKQIAWAQSLRHKMLTNFAIFSGENASNPQIIGLTAEMERLVATVTDVKFYIEHQSDFRTAIKAMRQ